MAYLCHWMALGLGTSKLRVSNSSPGLSSGPGIITVWNKKAMDKWIISPLYRTMTNSLKTRGQARILLSEQGYLRIKFNHRKPFPLQWQFVTIWWKGTVFVQGHFSVFLQIIKSLIVRFQMMCHILKILMFIICLLYAPAHQSKFLVYLHLSIKLYSDWNLKLF